MEHKIVMAGFGGQGIMAIGQLTTYAGMVEGKHVSWLPSYLRSISPSMTSLFILSWKM